MIKAAVGKVLYYFTDHNATQSPMRRGPMLALVTEVIDDRLVKVFAFDPVAGATFKEVRLLQDKDEADDRAYCAWPEEPKE